MNISFHKETFHSGQYMEHIQYANIDRDSFEHWVTSHDDNQPVGQARLSHFCPLYKFVNKDEDIVRAVGADYVRRIEDEGEYKLPLWAQEFIAAVDQTGVDESRRIDTGEPIFKQQALAALHNIQIQYYAKPF